MSILIKVSFYHIINTSTNIIHLFIFKFIHIKNLLLTIFILLPLAIKTSIHLMLD